jgi:hypothetical protein
MDFTRRFIYHDKVISQYASCNKFSKVLHEFSWRDSAIRAQLMHIFQMNWRVSPHCGVVNLVRSGRKQPQLLTASAGVRLASYFEFGAAMKNIAINSKAVSIKRVKGSSFIRLNLPVISSVV